MSEDWQLDRLADELSRVLVRITLREGRVLAGDEYEIAEAVMPVLAEAERHERERIVDPELAKQRPSDWGEAERKLELAKTWDEGRKSSALSANPYRADAIAAGPRP